MGARFGGKLIRQSLKTDKLSVAQLRLGDLLKEERSRVEARLVRWQDVNFDKMEIRVHNSKSALSTGKADFRFVPIIPPMRELLERIKPADAAPDAPVCAVGECEKSLTRACRLANVPRITHHDLRHLFATRCIESGVDIPTVSRWLGHSDGGALAMKVYGHLRREHSANMAQKVTLQTS